jgi:hypothetical protein
MFPDTTSKAGAAAIPCQQFLIPPLDDDELEEALSQIAGLRLLHENGTEAFRALLTVPFNLWLIERVLGTGVNPIEFSRTGNSF